MGDRAPTVLIARSRAYRIRRRAAIGVHYLWLAPLALLIEFGARFVPLPRLCRWLGVALTGDPSWRHAPVLSGAEQRRVRAALSLMRRWPFGDGTCLRRSLLVGLLLRRHRPVLRIGVGDGTGGADAHAWLQLGSGTIGQAGTFLPLSFDTGTP